MNPEAQRLRETMRVHHLTPEAMAKKIVTELGITEEMVGELRMDACEDPRACGDSMCERIDKVTSTLSTLLEVANS